MDNKQKELFDSLAVLSVPFERAIKQSLDLIKQDKEIKGKYRDELIASVKALLFNNLELHEYLRQKDSNLDFCKGGNDRYLSLRNEFKELFPRFADRDNSLLKMLENESDRRVEKSFKGKKSPKRT